MLARGPRLHPAWVNRFVRNCVTTPFARVPEDANFTFGQWAATCHLLRLCPSPRRTRCDLQILNQEPCTESLR